jgi:ABC-type transport system involved in multi-copper enzyme maturation permease subunit
MKAFKVFFEIEIKQFYRNPIAIAFLVLFIVALFFVLNGISQNKAILEKKDSFREIEHKKVELYRNYGYYGAVGLRMLFVPGACTALFNNNFSAITELTANFDSGDVLNLSRSYVGGNLFTLKVINFNDFAGIILIFGSLLGLFMALESMRHREFLKQQASISGARRVFLFIILSRLIIHWLFLVITTVFAYLLLIVNHITVNANSTVHILFFLLVMLVVMAFFHSIGTSLATCRSKNMGKVLLFTAWFVFIFLLPALINLYISEKSKSLPDNYRIELKKLALLTKFENRAIDVDGKFDISKRNTDIRRTLAEIYLNNEFKEIQELEAKREAGMRKLAAHLHMISSFFPSTFYLSCANEISSSGYKSVIDFYRDSRGLKDEFTRYYIHKQFFTEETKVRDFVNKDENIYYSRSHLPDYFRMGIVLAVCLTTFIFLLSYYRFRKYLFSPSKEAVKEFEGFEGVFDGGQFKVWKIESPFFTEVMYSLFSGVTGWVKKLGFKGKILFGKIDVIGSGIKEDFLYMASPSSIPGYIEVRDLILLIAASMKLTGEKVASILENPGIQPLLTRRFGQLKKLEASKIMMALIGMGKHSIFLVNDIAARLSRDFFIDMNDTFEALGKGGALVVYATTTHPPVDKDEPQKNERSFWEEEGWFHDIEMIKRKRNNSMIKSKLKKSK